MSKILIRSVWMYGMIISAIISLIISLIVLTRGIFYFRKTTDDKPMKTLTILVWLLNIFALLCWAFLRTNIMITLNQNICQFIYIGNFLFYMFSKYFLHILLIYKLYVTFDRTIFALKKIKYYTFLIFVTFNFSILTILWFMRVNNHVHIGENEDSSKQICTYYNSSTQQQKSIYDKIFPILLGLEDACVGIITLYLYLYKLQTLIKNAQTSDAKLYYKLMKKFVVCAFWTICSTFIFYTLAILIFPDLTFLLPIDVGINTLCVYLMFSFGTSFYTKYCYFCDILLSFCVKTPNTKKLELSKIPNLPSTTSEVYISRTISQDGTSQIQNTPTKDTTTVEIVQITANTETQATKTIIEEV